MAYYHDQHLAWQQRISKELFSATRFLNEYTPQSRPSTKSSLPSTKESPFLAKTDLRHINVFAEVRGKYARPALIINQRPEFPSITAKENPLLVRPTTSGSLQPRNALSTNTSRRKTQSLIEDPEEHIESPKKSENGSKAIQTPQRFNKIKYRSMSNDPEPVLEEKIEEFEVNLDSEQDKNEEIDEVHELQDCESFKASQYSSSSQRRIMELEALLQEEKLKRVELEQSLKKFIEEKSNNS